jgi:hypothetical protein
LLIGPKFHFNLDEFRRAIEGIEREKYEAMTYYERWLTAIETCLVQKGVLTREEVDERVGELVRFDQVDLWADYEGPQKDTLCIDIFEHWLEDVMV